MTLPTQKSVLAGLSVYGKPWGSDMGSASIDWQRKNLVRVPFPFNVTYADKPVASALLHRACADEARKFYAMVWDAAREDQNTIDEWGMSIYGGGFNYRLMRGGNQLSMHSFGCAVDHDPARNGLGDATPRFATFPLLVQAIRASGVCWGADWNGNGSLSDTRTHDGMHFQWTQPVG